MEDNNNPERNPGQGSAKKTAQKVGGLLFVGCMFLGMAAGWYFGRLTIGMFSGMGIGFIMMAVVWMSAANKQ